MIGNRDSLHNLINLHMPMLYRIALQNVQNKNEAEDISQEAFARLLETNKTFNDEEHIKAWLIKVTLNLCNDSHRKNEKRDFNNTRERTYLQNLDEHIDIVNSLSRMRKQYRNVLYLYYYEQYTVPEIAQMLNKTKNTVNTWIRRARKELASILKNE